jgi:hypothetical protein
MSSGGSPGPGAQQLNLLYNSSRKCSISTGGCFVWHRKFCKVLLKVKKLTVVNVSRIKEVLRSVAD